MPIDHRYHRDERLILRIAGGLGLLIGVLAVWMSMRFNPIPQRVSEAEVWAHIEALAPAKGIDPEFVYAIAWAESSLNAKARSSVARGIMQMTELGWREVTEESYKHAWDWRSNIRVAIDYMDFCRDYLHRYDEFSYPLLAACYRYGPYYVKDNDFKMSKMKEPENEIYKRIFKGDIRPVVPPGGTVAR